MIFGMSILWTLASRIAHPVHPRESSRFAALPLWQELRHHAAILAFSPYAHPWAGTWTSLILVLWPEYGIEL